jgi:hypothetical protein
MKWPLCGVEGRGGGNDNNTGYWGGGGDRGGGDSECIPFPFGPHCGCKTCGRVILLL